MSNRPSLSDLRIVKADRAAGDLPPFDQPVTEKVNIGLARIDQPAIKLGSFFVDGIEQVHGKTTNIIRSHVAVNQAAKLQSKKPCPWLEKRRRTRFFKAQCLPSLVN
jgi:hypothetical protein